MRRRRRRNTQNLTNVSLFSFIDVIGGMIGALSLIIISISLSHIIPNISSVPHFHFQKRLLETQIQKKTTQINNLQKKISDIELLKTNLQQASLKLVTLQQAIDRMTIDQAKVYNIVDAKEALQTDILSLKKKRNRLQKDIVSLNKAANEIKGNIVRDKIEVHFTGRGRNLSPTFVECTNKGLVIHGKKTKMTISKHIISNSDRFYLLLKQIKSKAKGTIIFLIRPDGILSFNRALLSAQKYNVRTGKLPIPGFGEIDLTHYKE